MNNVKNSRLTRIPTRKILGGPACRLKLCRGDVADPLRLVDGQLGTELVPYKACCCPRVVWPQLTCTQ